MIEGYTSSCRSGKQESYQISSVVNILCCNAQMLIQMCYERPFVKTTGLVEWLALLGKLATITGFESQKLISLFLFVQEKDFHCFFGFFFPHETFIYMTR